MVFLVSQAVRSRTRAAIATNGIHVVDCRRRVEKNNDGSGPMESATLREASGDRTSQNPCLSNQCERVLPLVDRPVPDADPAPVESGLSESRSEVQLVIGPRCGGGTSNGGPHEAGWRHVYFPLIRGAFRGAPFRLKEKEGAMAPSLVRQLHPIELPQFRHL